jgi:hypothetical protein
VLLAVAIAVVVVGLGVVAALALTRNEASSPRPTPLPPGATATPTIPARPPFFFSIQSRTPARAGKGGGTEAQDAAIEIGSRLSAFYDAAFMDPNTWANGLPDEAWSIFDPSVIDRAMGDADALTLGDAAPGLTELEATRSALDVKVLLDPQGTPSAAVADVTFRATGTLQDGQEVDVVNTASFLLEMRDGQWVVVGYPDANTKLTSAPTAAPSNGGTGQPAPSGSASP